MADVTPLNAIMRRHRAIEIGNGEKNHDPGSSKLISSVTDLMSELLAVSLLKSFPAADFCVGSGTLTRSGLLP